MYVYIYIDRVYIIKRERAREREACVRERERSKTRERCVSFLKKL
jgi:hypothetical protein